MSADPASAALVAPALQAYRSACAVARRYTVGGVLLDRDLIGIRRRVARAHSITPDDLKRWVELYGRSC